METLVGATIEQRRPEDEPTQGPQGDEGQIEQQPLLSGKSAHVSYSKFIKLEPPTSFGSNVLENPQQFLGRISRVCRPHGCSSQRIVH